jgi:hypothetical protein
LAAEGYRAARDSHHYRVIQSLTFTICAEPTLVAQVDRFRKKRNIGTYEIAGAASEMEAEEMIMVAENLRKQVEEWLRENHPGLLSRKS